MQKLTMKKFVKTNLKDIPLEDAHGGAGKRQMLVAPEHVTTKHLEAITKGYLQPGEGYPLHVHEDMDEICIVLRGQGKFACEDEEFDYQEGDVFSVHAGAEHTYKAEGDSPTEFYFVRVKV